MLGKILLVTSSFILIAPVFAEDDGEDAGVMKTVDLPLSEEIRFDEKQPLRKSFHGFAVEGWLNSESEWSIKGTVSHSRLRCATYRLGVQLGKGHPGCLNTEWVTGISYGTRETQCNSATLVHQGGGEMPALTTQLKDATCVRVVTQCKGVCN
jgi:hypothetical protein